jgi:soluble lytic murein transglycosylase-like protein
MMTLIMAFAATTAMFDLPPGLLSAVCYVETKHTASAIHHNDGGSDSLGVCQIKFQTAKELGFKGTPETLRHDSKANIHYAGKYLKKQLHRYDGDAIKAIAAYNAGTYRVNTKGRIKNLHYVNKVFNVWTGEYANN